MQSLKYRFVLSVMRLVAALPWSWLRVLGTLLGWIFWRFDTREKTITLTNLELCLPELDAAARTELARASLVDFGQTALEMPKVWLSEPSQVLVQIAAVEGEELIREPLAQQRGVMILAPHHGNWELVGLYLGQRYGITSMYLPSQGAAIEGLVRAARSRSGATLVPADASGVRNVFKVMKKGGIVGVLPDQVPKTGVEPAPFFGHPAQTMTLVSNLLHKTGAAAVMAAALRQPDGRFRLVFSAPDAGIYAPELAASLTGLNRSVEAMVRAAPAQYQWEYKRFKQPRGVPSVYDRMVGQSRSSSR